VQAIDPADRDTRSTLGRPLKVAVLCSHRAPGLVHALNRHERRGADYEIVCCITSSDTFAEEVRVERRGVPCVPHSVRAFCRGRGTEPADLEARVAYDTLTLAILEPFNPDVLVLDGYALLLTDPVLETFDGRIVAMHNADLRQRNALGAPKYPGPHAVRDALLAGEAETRVTSHIVTSRLDDGPVLVRSWGFPVPPVAVWAREHHAVEVLRAAAWAHHQWMIREAWGPMLMRTFERATHAAVSPRRPLDVARAGHWLLEPDGTLTPDFALATV
jgi:folate-dependent phosphoribosylglycinamide formyltransferase PurN